MLGLHSEEFGPGAFEKEKENKGKREKQERESLSEKLHFAIAIILKAEESTRKKEGERGKEEKLGKLYIAPEKITYRNPDGSRREICSRTVKAPDLQRKAFSFFLSLSLPTLSC